MTKLGMTILSLFAAFALLAGCETIDREPTTRVERNTTTGVQTFNEGGMLEIPRSANPNDDTLRHHWRIYNTETTSRRFSSRPSPNPLRFRFDLRDAPTVRREMADTALVSYLLYENGAVVVDEMSPPERLGGVISNDTHMKSFSVGKSLASYLLGHAICRGYIDGIDATLSDWPLVSDSLYASQTLQDIVNMRSRDFAYMGQANTKRTNRNMNVETLKSLMDREFKGSTPGEDVFNYNNMNPKLVLNYISYKTGHNFSRFLSEVMEQHVRLEDALYYNISFNNGRLERDGILSQGFYATRYDYLRIAVAMLNDWNSNTCVGQYLKSIHQNRESRNPGSRRDPRDFMPGAYGGFFWADYRGMRGRNVMGMDGYPGHAILIDFDNSRIVVAHSIHHTYDWQGIVYDVIRTGRL